MQARNTRLNVHTKLVDVLAPPMLLQGTVRDYHRMKAEALHAQLFATAVALQQLVCGCAKLCFLGVSNEHLREIADSPAE